MASPEFVGQSQVAQDQATPIHFYTYLLNLGISSAEVRSAGDELWRRVKFETAKLALSDDVTKRLRYTARTPHGKLYRSRVNRQIIADAVLSMRFTRDELSRLDEGLRLGLVTSETTGRRFAKVTGVNGQPQEFEVITEDLGHGVEKTLLKDVHTGHITHVA